MNGSKRHVCAKENPWNDGMDVKAVHPDAEFVSSEDGYPGGDISWYKCPHCGLTFDVEMAQ
jgi:hypothetical protein